MLLLYLYFRNVRCLKGGHKYLTRFDKYLTGLIHTYLPLNTVSAAVRPNSALILSSITFIWRTECYFCICIFAI